MEPDRTHFKTVVISDVHMGTPHAKIGEVTRFLGRLSCDRLILAGDIIDGWQLKQVDDKWTVQESAFFSVIMKMLEKDQTEVVYVTGNHDDFLDNITPCQLFFISFVGEYMLEDFGKRYVVIHGHAFDSITTQFRWLSKLGGLAYNALLKFNNVWNRAREKSGKGRYSFSKAIKHGVKRAVNLISGFELDLADYARSKKCDGIICGHIHHPEDKILKNGVRYLNCGDWVESMTALVEDVEGNWKILGYNDLVTG